jgi:hypothetical protein
MALDNDRMQVESGLLPAFAVSNRRIVVLVLALTIAGVVAIVIARPAIKHRAESVMCGNYMSSIGFASRLWAHDHDGRFPSDFLAMSNELVAPRILVCPGDHARQRATNWSSFNATNSSYEIVAPGLREDDTNTVFFRCKYHGHRGYTDATIFDGMTR